MPRPVHTATNPPSGREATLAKDCPPLVSELTVNSIPSGWPKASNRRALTSAEGIPLGLLAQATRKRPSASVATLVPFWYPDVNEFTRNSLLPGACADARLAV